MYGRFVLGQACVEKRINIRHGQRDTDGLQAFVTRVQRYQPAQHKPLVFTVLRVVGQPRNRVKQGLRCIAVVTHQNHQVKQVARAHAVL